MVAISTYAELGVPPLGPICANPARRLGATSGQAVADYAFELLGKIQRMRSPTPYLLLRHRHSLCDSLRFSWRRGTGSRASALYGIFVATCDITSWHGPLQRFWALWMHRGKLAFCVTSELPVSPWLRHSFTTRLLLTCISAKLYFKEETVDDLLSEICRQARELLLEGLTVPCLTSSVCAMLLEVDRFTFKFVCLGVKGDWAFARKVS